jgi:hypothetical protein
MLVNIMQCSFVRFKQHRSRDSCLIDMGRLIVTSRGKGTYQAHIEQCVDKQKRKHMDSIVVRVRSRSNESRHEHRSLMTNEC